MDDEPPSGKPRRPERSSETPVPPIPTVDLSKPGEASTEYSRYRTKLSKHRTALSEHRTSLSEYRTDLSTARTEMSRRRTGMSFQRTRMSADRTLMAVIRTSLALISFGFTIAEVFERLREQGVLASAAPARNFGTALVALGILMLVGGIVYHLQYMYGLRAERKRMTAQGLIHGETIFPLSLTLFTAIILLLIGIAAIVSMVFDIGPFG
ncbi:MAG TPA: DUF202 domain-containing protein [Longimicrobiales bacterium]